MKKPIYALLLIACTVAACNLVKSTPIPLASRLPAGWQDVQIRTISVEVQQSFLEIDPGFSLPVEAMLRRILTGLGLTVVSVGDESDARLFLHLKSAALAEDYQSILGNVGGHCFTGAQVSGELRLTMSDRSPLVFALSAGIPPPSTISACPKQPQDAPFDAVWPQAVLDGLLDLWGGQVLGVAIGDRDESVRLAAVRLVGDQGKEGIPLLVKENIPLLMKALGDRSAAVRARAVYALAAFGADATEAVPAIVEVLDDNDRPVRIAAASALLAITGQGFGDDQAAWRKWLKDPSLKPTPFTSWRGVAIAPGATLPEELGTQLLYMVQTPCDGVASYYLAEMPATGWALADDKISFAGAVRKLVYTKDREKAEINLNETMVTMTETRCRVQIFLLH